MSFPYTKTDCYGIAEAATIDITSIEDGKAAQEITAQGQDGSIVASEVFGVNDSPSCTYAIKSAVTWAAGAKKLGKVSAYNSTHKVSMLKVDITTAAGAVPTLKVSGKQVQDGATDASTYSIPATTIAPTTTAQILWTAFELSGSGCHLQSANYSAECTISQATKNGDCIAFDVSAAKLTAAISVKKVGEVEPTITAGQGWTITAPLSCSNPDAEYPTYSATLTKYLAKDAAQQGQ